MKRKYAAMVLRLTLALTSMNVAYAAEKDTTTAAEAAADTVDAETVDTSTDETVLMKFMARLHWMQTEMQQQL